MSKIVLDASALLALLNQESGAEQLTPELLRDATISTVNLAEVQTKLVREGGGPDEAWELALAPIAEAAPFSSDQAKTAGALVKVTRPLQFARSSAIALNEGQQQQGLFHRIANAHRPDRTAPPHRPAAPRSSGWAG